MARYGMTFKSNPANIVIVMSEYNGFKNFEDIFTNDKAADKFIVGMKAHCDPSYYFYKLHIPSVVYEVNLHGDNNV